MDNRCETATPAVDLGQGSHHLTWVHCKAMGRTVYVQSGEERHNPQPAGLVHSSKQPAAFVRKRRAQVVANRGQERIGNQQLPTLARSRGWIGPETSASARVRVMGCPTDSR